MPYWFENKNLRVGKENDKRRKLSEDDRKSIKEYYKLGYSIRAIARIFSKVSRRSIQFILFPDRVKRLYKYKKKERNWDYDREEHNKAIRKYRRYLKEIYGLSN